MDRYLNKTYGNEAFITGDTLSEKEDDILNVSPQIDFILGGGIPSGSVVTIAGDMKVGKTTLALHILGKAQQVGKPTYYINVEGRLKKRDVDGIHCLDPKKLNIVRSYRIEKDDEIECKIFTAEEFLKITEYIIHNIPNAVIVIDSISQLVTSTELEKEIGEQSRAPGAVLMAQFCKRLSNVIPVNNTILIGIMHMIANTTGYGAQKVISGGRKIQYAADIGLKCKNIKYIENEHGKIIGQEVNWITTSTGLNAPPGQSATSVIMYGHGIDEEAEIINLATEVGIIEKSGKWWTINCINDKKYNGKNAMLKFLRSDEEHIKKLKNSVYETIGILY